MFKSKGLCVSGAGRTVLLGLGLVTALGITATAQAEATADSRTTNYTYNDLGQVTSIDGPRTDVLDVTQYHYDERGNQVSVTNALGHTTQYGNYERNGLPGTVTDPNGRVTHLSYDWQGKVTEQRIEAPQGDLVTTYVHDPAGELIEIHPASGPSLFYEYDAAQRLVGLRNSAGERLDYELDAMGNVLSVQTFDASGQLVRQHQQAYDGLSRVRERIGGTEQQTTRYDYDANGNRTEIVDPKQNPTTRQQYDALNRLVEVTDRAFGVTHFDYNSQDRLSSVTDPRGVTTTYDYNGHGELIAVHSPDTGTTTYDYDNAGNRIRQTDANGQVTEYDYDAFNRRTAIRYPAQPERNIQYQYDDTSPDENGTANAGLGRLTGITFHGGERQLRFDSLGRLTAEIQIIDGQTYTRRYRYNAQGQLSATQLPSGAWLGYHYDDQGQPVRLSLQPTADAGPDQQRTVVDQLETLPFGPLQHLRYGNGIEQTNEYDLDYRLTGQQSSVWDQGYYYDLNTNVEQIVNWQQDSDHQTFQYDALDRLIDASASGLYGQHKYGYDPVGNRETKTENSATTDYGYAAQSNRLLNEAGWLYDYDAAGNLLGNGRFDFTYNEQGHLAQVHDAQSGDLFAEYSYNPNRQRIKKTVRYSGPDYAALAEQHQTLAEQHRQEAHSLNDQANGLTAQATQSQYEADQRTTEAQTQQALDDQHQAEADALTEQAETVQAHADDYYQSAADQAARIVEPANGFTQWFTNLIARMLSGWYTFVADYYQGQADALTETAAGQQAEAEQVQARADTLAQQAQDAQVRADQDNAEAKILSDQAKNHHEKADAALAQMTEYQAQAAVPSSGTQTTHFVYHPDGTLAGEYNEDGTARREYVYLAGRPIAVIEPGSTATPTEPSLYFIHSDHLGTPKVMTGPDQAVVWKATHTPFGEAMVQVEEITNNLRFPGQYYDEETGVHQNWHRYYNPATGRYITSDPIGLNGGLNTYGYAFQNPVNYVDPDGQLVLPLIPFLFGAGGSTTAGSGLGFWATGALFGGAVAVATIPGDTPVEDVDADTEEICPPEDDNCQPCKTISGKTVPVGTIAYRPLDVIADDEMQHGVYGSHHNIFVAKQNPNNCQCFWQKQKYVLKPYELTPDMIPIEPFVN